MKNSYNSNCVLFYDWLDKFGGVERMLCILYNILKPSKFYSSVYNPKFATWIQKNNINNIETSFLQKIPYEIVKHRIISALLFPIAFESFNISKYDLAFSVTSSFAKGIITKPETPHICILLSTTRFLWHDYTTYINTGIKRALAQYPLSYLRRWDYIAAQRPDYYICISKHVQKRLLTYYNRTGEVIYPPFDTSYWLKIKNNSKNNQNKNYYLAVSRLEPYKKIDLLINAFNSMPDKKLIIIGNGSQYIHLTKIANKNIIFLQNISDIELSQYYCNAQALIMPQEEDFGYVSLEAQIHNTPVLSYKKGGALETVLDNKTGLFFNHQTVTDIIKSIHVYEKISNILHQKIKFYSKSHLHQFDIATFTKKVHLYIQAVQKERKNNNKISQ